MVGNHTLPQCVRDQDSRGLREGEGCEGRGVWWWLEMLARVLAFWMWCEFHGAWNSYWELSASSEIIVNALTGRFTCMYNIKYYTCNSIIIIIQVHSNYMIMLHEVFLRGTKKS